MIGRTIGRLALACTILVWGMVAAWAAGPVETSVFAVQGVAVDVTDTDAATAKNKALVEAQMKAFVSLAERLGTPGLVEAVKKLESAEVMPYLKSLSIEEESTAPGRYIGKLTVRFLPSKVKALYGRFGVEVNDVQGEAMVIIPVWVTPEGPQLWEDNPWRRAWVSLRAEQAEVPIIIPLGDAEDTGMISPQEALASDPVKLEAVRRRYDVKTVLVATAETVDGGGVHARMAGTSPLGKISFDKVYTADTPTPEASATIAVQRFHTVMVDKFKSDEAKAVAAAAAAAAKTKANTSHSIPVAVPFASPSEWNGLRSRILSTPGVIGVDVSTLGGDGAVIRLMFVGDVADMQASLQATGLQLGQVGGSWVIQPL